MSQSKRFVAGMGRFVPCGPQCGASLMGGGGGDTPLVIRVQGRRATQISGADYKVEVHNQKNGNNTTIKSEGGEDDKGGGKVGAVRGKSGDGGGDEGEGGDNKGDGGGAEVESEVKAEAEVKAEEEEEEEEEESRR